jgi:hypothetical protein
VNMTSSSPSRFMDAGDTAVLALFAAHRHPLGRLELLIVPIFRPCCRSCC